MNPITILMGETKESSLPLTVAILIPDGLLCTLSNALMGDPVSLSDGYTYDRNNITNYLETHSTSPVTGLPLRTTTLRPDEGCLQQLANWRQRQNSSTSAPSAPSAPPAPPAPPAPSVPPLPPPTPLDLDQLSKGLGCIPSSLLKLSKHFRHLDPIRNQLATELSGWKPPVVVVFGAESW